ncbi:pilin [Pseudomonas frederiksbergensis]|uniref:Pilin n=1 Tax=Pseudomonas frederiksbergensis TaxID=104087 RepID=A0A423JSI4_9PSED|nr:pilin [Pseudomonas frederiksbergensis]RON40649.1 prepilin-type N-terminal cleavage/methylation domain-containing protein [Pseudomonas frederiksbergensis]RON58047.1 prepilin-type N-terminal cleavage/methylation domain-containing protein [Pseudomonas frederiksbergensis]
MNTQKGFTLIELLIVVAIIGILATFALPAYSKYQAKAKVTAGIAEASALKVAYEDVMNTGTADPTTALVAPGGTTTPNCTLAVTGTTASGAGTITCTLLNAPSLVQGKVITLTRVQAGTWACTTNALKEFSGTGCPGV